MSHRELLATAVAAAHSGAEILLRDFRNHDLTETDREVRQKASHDLVSRADHESEARIVELLRARYPDHDVLAEERGIDRGVGAGGSGPVAEYEWIIDPLDGTNNFLQGLPVFCISIACRQRGRLVAGVVYDPIGKNLFTAARGEGAHWDDRRLRIEPREGLGGAVLATGYPFRARTALDAYLAVFRDVFLRARAIRRCGAAALDLAYTAAGVYDGFFEFRLSPWDIAAGALLIEEAGGVVSDLDGGSTYFTGGNVLAGAPGLHDELLRTASRYVSEARMDELDPRTTTSLPSDTGAEPQE